jgi:hypothetical protein
MVNRRPVFENQAVDRCLVLVLGSRRLVPGLISLIILAS